MSKSATVLALLSAHAASASAPFLPQAVVRDQAEKVDKQYRAVMRFLDDQADPCEPDGNEMQRLTGDAACAGIQEAFQEHPDMETTEGIFEMIDTMCKYGKCFGLIMEATKKATASDECKAAQTDLADEFALCSAANADCAAVEAHCEPEGFGCQDSRQVTGDGDDFGKAFEGICARKDADTTCFEAVFKPFFAAMEAAGSTSDGVIKLSDECGEISETATAEEQQLYECCVLESYGCCLISIQAITGENIDTTDLVNECPALATVQACPNPFKDTTYLKFELEAACLGKDSEELVLLKEGLVSPWGVDAGSIELVKGTEDKKVNVVVTVPEDQTASALETKIKGSTVDLQALSDFKNASCTLADTSNLQVAQTVVEPQSTSSASAVLVGSLALLAFF